MFYENEIITLEKKYKINFLWKKMTPKLVVLQSWKKLKVLEKDFFSKKIPQLIRVDKTFKKVYENFFDFNGCRNIYSLVILRFRKIALHDKIINETRLTKNQENSAHHLGDNYLTNHLVKFLHDRIKPWRLGALRVCTGYHF